MLTLGQAARLGTVAATGPAVRHATPDVTDAELRHWVSRVEKNAIELHSTRVRLVAAKWFEAV